MGDTKVSARLRSEAPLVVVEAPAGCGKTYQGSRYAAEVLHGQRGRVLVLTHTHAAADAFHSRAKDASYGVDIRTIDSLFVEIATAYHSVLQLPEDVGRWASQERNGFAKVAARVASLLENSSSPARALVQRYPVIVFDEHQDASDSQGALLVALLRAGALVRAFGDPMQAIYAEPTVDTSWNRWDKLCARAGMAVKLNTPHRWIATNPEMGEWILRAREALKSGGVIDLRKGLPEGVAVYRADNKSTVWGNYRTSIDDARPIRGLARAGDVMFLASQNPSVKALRSYFGRHIPIWEGHTRPALDKLVQRIEVAQGDPCGVAAGFVTFVQEVAIGFSNSRFATRFLREIAEKCSKRTRGVPAALQDLGRCIIQSPDHRGVATCLKALWHLARRDRAFQSIIVDYVDEFWDAVRLGEFEDVWAGMKEIQNRRSQTPGAIPKRSLTTIHKAKGLETDCVVIMPCDSAHFRDRLKDRCALYVAMSRARRRLVFVVPRRNPSPLLSVD